MIYGHLEFGSPTHRSRTMYHVSGRRLRGAEVRQDARSKDVESGADARDASSPVLAPGLKVTADVLLHLAPSSLPSPTTVTVNGDILRRVKAELT